MQDELKTSTAIGDGIVALPDGGAGDPAGESAAVVAGVQSNLPPNERADDLTKDHKNRISALKPDATGPPKMASGGDADYWNSLINEKAAAQFLGMTHRWMQSKRYNGGGPVFVRISQRCIRYRRIDLKEYADQQLRSSTSDQSDAA